MDLRKTTPEQEASLLRFCSLPRTINVYYDEGPVNVKKTDACLGYEKDRPFSGRDMASLNHGWCNVWNTDKGWMTCEGYEDKTFRNGKKLSEVSALTCKEAIAEKTSFKYALCRQWSDRVPCEKPAFPTDFINYSETAIGKLYSSPGVFNSAPSNRRPHYVLPPPTSGFYCRK